MTIVSNDDSLDDSALTMWVDIQIDLVLCRLAVSSRSTTQYFSVPTHPQRHTNQWQENLTKQPPTTVKMPIQVPYNKSRGDGEEEEPNQLRNRLTSLPAELRQNIFNQVLSNEDLFNMGTNDLIEVASIYAMVHPVIWDDMFVVLGMWIWRKNRTNAVAVNELSTRAVIAICKVCLEREFWN
jgi:hypothetical protein